MTKKTKKEPARRTKTTASKRKRPSLSVPLWRQPVAWGFLIALMAFVIMVTFGRLPAPVEKAATDTSAEARNLANVRLEIETFLAGLGLSSEDVTQAPSQDVIDLRLDATYPDDQQVQDFTAGLDTLDAFRVERYLPGNELRVFSGPALIARLQFTIKKEEPSSPMVSIIMDDLGQNLEVVSRLLELEAPVTMAILPSTPHAQRAAELAHARGREVMVHIPMEPQGYPAIEPGRDALLLQHDSWEIKRRLEDMFKRVPYAVGGNNHMGSRYTEYAAGMEVVAEFMADKELFFVDSRTTGKTLAEQAMRQLKVPAMSRDVFLDNNKEVETIRKEIRHLVTLAQRHGYAVGICHPYSETLEALEQELPAATKSGVKVVSVSQLLAAVQALGN